MRQALQQSLFTPHKSFIFLLGIFAAERMWLFLLLFFAKTVNSQVAKIL